MHLEEAAYNAYRQLNRAGQSRIPLPEFAHLPKAEQDVWTVVVNEVLTCWLSVDFREAINNDEFVEQYALRMVKVGHERGDDSISVIRAVITTTVIAVVDPEILDELAKQRAPQVADGEESDDEESEDV